MYQEPLAIPTAPIGIALVAPSSYVPDEAALERGLEVLRAQGCMVYNYYNPAAKYQRFGGTDAARIAQLYAAVDNPQVQVVLMVRGGYGMTRLLPQLDFHRLAASKKQFVGHSDFTAFQMALLAQTGQMSFAGPMLSDDFTRTDLSAFTLSHFWQCLQQSGQTLRITTSGNPMVNVNGILWGGNLAMLTHLVGTPYFPQIDGGILFLEDVNEQPFRIERMLLQLQYAGILERQQAIVLGDFSNYRVTDYDNGYDFEAMLAYVRAHTTVPILTGLPFGHIRDKVTLPVGGWVRLTSDNDGFELNTINTLTQ